VFIDQPLLVPAQYFLSLNCSIAIRAKLIPDVSDAVPDIVDNFDIAVLFAGSVIRDTGNVVLIVNVTVLYAY
jgi:hypothetical protein